MGNTVYASFVDASLAEKAVGALLDFGVRAEDISVVRGNKDIENVSTAYSATSPIPENERTWTGENRNVEANRLGYTGNVYDTANSGIAGGIAASELQAEMSGYGTTATDTVREPIVYPDDRELESKEAMTSTSVGHDPNLWEREDRSNENDIERAAKDGISTTTAADAAAGAVKGVAWGTGLGVAAAVASLIVPGFGLILGGGALAVALGGVVASAGAGAAAGAVTGFLKDQGMDDHVAADYEGAVLKGGAMVAVSYPSGNCDEATIRKTLEKYGAIASNMYPNAYAS